MTASERASTPPRSARRFWRPLRWTLAAAFGALAVGTVAANVVVRASARPFLRGSPSEVRAPVAIVPGASVHRDGTPSRQLSERLLAALTLMRAGRVERILVSGARNGAYDEAGPMHRWLSQRGIATSAIVDDHAGFRTLDTMERAARVFAVHQAVICTQSFHLPRAVFLARRAGIDAVGFSADGAVSAPSMTTLVRESLADLMAVVDTYLLRRQPRELGGGPSARPPHQPVTRQDGGG